MKKVGLMTWFTFNNYGSVLQAYALGEIIKTNGLSVEYIDYQPKVKPKNIFDDSLIINFEKLLERINLSKITSKKETICKKFDAFRDEFSKSNKCYSFTDLKMLCNSYDYLVCGSDQIWSPNAYDENYFLIFSDSANKIAYSPSFGVSDIHDKLLKSRIIDMVSDFKNVSVREENGKKILEDNSICKTLDPTLLLSSNSWDKLLNLKKTNNKKYILCYFLGKNSRYYKIANRLAQINNYDLLIIPTNEMSLRNHGKILEDCGPKEFINYIKNADLVLTDSYHGMLFSINYNKEFIVFERFKNNKESQNSRIYNTLKEFSLEDRLYKEESTCLFLTNINYDIVNQKLNKLRKNSLDYLKNSFLNCSSINENISKPTHLITKMCTGCGMCASVCPKKCIEIKQNEFGFFEYIVDEKKCINCGLCKKVCAQCQNNAITIDNKKLFACRTNDKQLLMNSASGGVASEMSKLAINKGLFVLGCEYNLKDNMAKHIIVKKIEELNLLSGSKYLQSYTVDAFKNLKNIDKGIVFATPCQIASVDNYLKNMGKRDDFILVDIICHGVPTYNIWNRIVKNNITSVNFRNKKYGWHNKVLTINDKKISNHFFYDFFDSNCVYNKCCYDCNYRNKSAADIRIGDFWGNKYKKDNYGISMVILLTSKGEKFFNDLNIYKHLENISDYKKNQQYENISLPLNYYNLMMDLSKKTNTLDQVHRKYIKKIVLDKKMRKIFHIFK